MNISVKTNTEKFAKIPCVGQVWMHKNDIYRNKRICMRIRDEIGAIVFPKLGLGYFFSVDLKYGEIVHTPLLESRDIIIFADKEIVFEEE